jgi:RNA polymerase sigma factor (TIGR02999 family)
MTTLASDIRRGRMEETQVALVAGGSLWHNSSDESAIEAEALCARAAMSENSQDMTMLLVAAAEGDPKASDAILPLVYDHLRELARKRIAKEAPGQTLQPTALVHEAYLRLVGDGVSWSNRRHFFAAAAIAMRRILVERARAKHGPKRGGGRARVPLTDAIDRDNVEGGDTLDWLALDEALSALQVEDPDLAQVVHLRYFAGLSVDDTAAALGRSSRTIDREWKVARAWLLKKMSGEAA